MRLRKRGDDDLWIVSDECYESLTFEGRHGSIASLGPEVKARTLTVNTCSKAYAMMGWRIGYAAGPRELIRAMTSVANAERALSDRTGPQGGVD